uniref:CCDC92 domain-containing protein n=1 Tax=Ascaris lumbricoides TaxID=6252 RepID=A0A0M3HSF6_ASCLU
MKREIISAQQALAESQHLLNELQKPNRRLHAEADEMKREIISAQQALAESQHLLNELQKPNNQFTEADAHERTVAGASASTRSTEFTDYEKQLSALRDKLALFQAEVKMKDDEIRRLELEIGNAHRCNQQLNAKLGSLSSSSAVELKLVGAVSGYFSVGKNAVCDTNENQQPNARKAAQHRAPKALVEENTHTYAQRNMNA